MKKLLLVLVLLSTPSFAQQQPPADIPTLQRAIAVLQAQRNSASDAMANAEMKVLALTEELTQAKAKIKDLEEKAKPDAK